MNTLQDVQALMDGGFSARLPCGMWERFAPSAAAHLVGSCTRVTAHEFGLADTWMRIVSAEVVDEGRALDVRLVPDS